MQLPDPSEGPAAAAAIARRREALRDDALEALSLDDFLGVARYVVAHPNVPRGVLVKDILDALALTRCAHADADRWERALISKAREIGVTWDDISKALKLRKPQGAMNRFLRLDNYIGAGGRRSEVDARRARSGAISGPEWLAVHAARIEEVARELAAAAFSYPAADEDLDGLTSALAERPPSAKDLLVWVSSLLSTVTVNGTRPLPSGQVWRKASELRAEWRRARKDP